MLKIKKIKPLFTGIITTADKYEEDETADGLIIDSKKTQGTLKEYQRILSIGSSVREVKVGDIVLINPTRYLVRDKASPDANSLANEFIQAKYHLEIPQMEVNGESVLTIEERDVAFILEEYDEISDTPKKQPSLILPKKQELIL